MVLIPSSDQEEAERLESQHQVFNRVFDNRLIFPPVPRLRRILDCGYGAGSWAVDVAERHPDCEVGSNNVPVVVVPANPFNEQGHRS